MDGSDLRIRQTGLHWLEFDDSDALTAMLAPWGVELTQFSRLRGKGRFGWARLSDLDVRAVAVTGSHHVGGALPAGNVTLQIDFGSNGARRVGGQALDTDDIMVGFAGASIDFTSAERHCGMNFGVPQAVVTEAVASRAPGVDLHKRSASLSIMSNARVAANRIRGLARAAFGPASLDAPDHARSDLVDALVGTLLLPWTREQPVTFRPPHYQRLPLVRRIEEFMRANLGEPLMLHDLCAAARASERAVEYAFRDTYGVGAKQYLKLLRLNQVRRELKALPPGIATVTSTAHQYGFWHMGHFSVAYRRLFGETPRQTRAQRVPIGAWETGPILALPA
jgi:AraC family ethanolamine operon transcriptional activator